FCCGDLRIGLAFGARSKWSTCGPLVRFLMVLVSIDWYSVTNFMAWLLGIAEEWLGPIERRMVASNGRSVTVLASAARKQHVLWPAKRFSRFKNLATIRGVWCFPGPMMVGSPGKA